MGLIGNGTGKSKVGENLAVAILIIAILPVLIYRNVTNKPNAVKIYWDWWLFKPVVLPIRWAQRGWKATRRALGWDQLR